MKALWLYVARDDPATADALLDRMKVKLERLAERPGLGRRRSEFAVEVRTVPLHDYLLCYRPIEDGIQLLRVVHGARDLSAIAIR